MRADLLERRCAEMRARFAAERAKRFAQGIRNKSFAEKTKRMRDFWDGVYRDRLIAKSTGTVTKSTS